jgi:hypothetical protein
VGAKTLIDSSPMPAQSEAWRRNLDFALKKEGYFTEQEARNHSRYGPQFKKTQGFSHLELV